MKIFARRGVVTAWRIVSGSKAFNTNGLNKNPSLPAPSMALLQCSGLLSGRDCGCEHQAKEPNPSCTIVPDISIVMPAVASPGVVPHISIIMPAVVSPGAHRCAWHFNHPLNSCEPGPHCQRQELRHWYQTLAFPSRWVQLPWLQHVLIYSGLRVSEIIRGETRTADITAPWAPTFQYARGDTIYGYKTTLVLQCSRWKDCLSRFESTYMYLEAVVVIFPSLMSAPTAANTWKDVVCAACSCLNYQTSPRACPMFI